MKCWLDSGVQGNPYFSRYTLQRAVHRRLQGQTESECNMNILWSVYACSHPEMSSRASCNGTVVGKPGQPRSKCGWLLFVPTALYDNAREMHRQDMITGTRGETLTFIGALEPSMYGMLGSRRTRCRGMYVLASATRGIVDLQWTRTRPQYTTTFDVTSPSTP